MVAKLESLMRLIGILCLTPEGQALIPCSTVTHSTLTFDQARQGSQMARCKMNKRGQ